MAACCGGGGPPAPSRATRCPKPSESSGWSAWRRRARPRGCPARLHARGDAAAALRLAGDLAEFWAVRGHLREGRGWLERALALGGDAPAAVRAKALRGLGWPA